VGMVRRNSGFVIGLGRGLYRCRSRDLEHANLLQ
jgi:hypothetical protein